MCQRITKVVKGNPPAHIVGESLYSGKQRGKQKMVLKESALCSRDPWERDRGKNVTRRMREKVEMGRYLAGAGPPSSQERRGAPQGERDAPPKAGRAVSVQHPIKWENQRLSWGLGSQAEGFRGPSTRSQCWTGENKPCLSKVCQWLGLGCGEGMEFRVAYLFRYAAAMFLRTCAIPFVQMAPYLDLDFSVSKNLLNVSKLSSKARFPPNFPVSVLATCFRLTHLKYWYCLGLLPLLQSAYCRHQIILFFVLFFDGGLVARVGSLVLWKRRRIRT